MELLPTLVSQYQSLADAPVPVGARWLGGTGSTESSAGRTDRPVLVPALKGRSSSMMVIAT